MLGDQPRGNLGKARSLARQMKQELQMVQRHCLVSSQYFALMLDLKSDAARQGPKPDRTPRRLVPRHGPSRVHTEYVNLRKFATRTPRLNPSPQELDVSVSAQLRG